MTDGIKRQDRGIPLQEVIEWAEFDPIWASRGKAIQAYAELESALCNLLRALTDLTWEAAVTVFYKITSTAARNSILEKLLHQKCGQKFNVFWNPFAKELRIMDLKRNEIVHWLAAANVLLNDNGQLLVGVTLVPPASIPAKSDSPYINSQELIDYADKCDNVSRLINGLAARIKPPKGADAIEPWLDIYQLPFVYPLPEGHPISQKQPAPENHPRSLPPSLQFLRPDPASGHLRVWSAP